MCAYSIKYLFMKFIKLERKDNFKINFGHNQIWNYIWRFFSLIYLTLEQRCI